MVELNNYCATIISVHKQSISTSVLKRSQTSTVKMVALLLNAEESDDMRAAIMTAIIRPTSPTGRTFRTSLESKTKDRQCQSSDCFSCHGVKVSIFVRKSPYSVFCQLTYSLLYSFDAFTLSVTVVVYQIASHIASLYYMQRSLSCIHSHYIQVFHDELSGSMNEVSG